ncbi:hypothetical protein K2173_006034 [Erythroxylum novogranatense]|uniref:Uncharacterized protein n=1 Tax=Erythroxylum novogranatense TaxID=1862640 RepID=A0AAV8TE62_9ROSI|nr:hypothetical protein K2173_006034 [Erythroxylum novogranatense]
MAAMRRSLSFLVVFLLVISAFMEVQARPFNMVKARNSASRVIENFFDGLSLGAIKESGPSPGVGHKFTDRQTFGGIKAGPSPGVGHKFTSGTHQ